MWGEVERGEGLKGGGGGLRDGGEGDEGLKRQ